MTARDDYPANEMGFAQRRAMCDEIDRLREVIRLCRPYMPSDAHNVIEVHAVHASEVTDA